MELNLPQQIANHFRQIYFGGNWTDSNLKDILKDVSWQQATTKLYLFNTIAALAYHMNYFSAAILNVIQAEPISTKDKFSFDHPPVNSQEDWVTMLNNIWNDAEKVAVMIEQLPLPKLREIFSEEKYGNIYSNILGIIEHNHYHLGQIVVLKKLLELPKP